jgi:hypothetical protein
MIAAHVPNLFDRARFGNRVEFVETADEAAALGPSLLLVDLDRCDDLSGFRLPGATVIGFGPHVDSSLHARAVAAGYDEVLARSVFFRRLPEILDTGTRPERPDLNGPT